MNLLLDFLKQIIPTFGIVQTLENILRGTLNFCFHFLKDALVILPNILCSLFLFFNHSSHSILFCISFRYVEEWLDNDTLHKVSSLVFPVPT